MSSWREMQFEPGIGASASAFSNGHHAKSESIARRLANKETIHLNSTPAGGGVAEILSSLIPLSHWYGLSARWMVIPPNQAFFGVTRRMHDYLVTAGPVVDDVTIDVDKIVVVQLDDHVFTKIEGGRRVDSCRPRDRSSG